MSKKLIDECAEKPPIIFQFLVTFRGNLKIKINTVQIVRLDGRLLSDTM